MDDFLPKGRLHLLLKASFQGGNCNTAVENSFARLKSMSKSGRGRRDLSHSICCKHYVAELKKAHLEHADKFCQQSGSSLAIVASDQASHQSEGPF